jgi:hypothetical protein
MKGFYFTIFRHPFIVYMNRMLNQMQPVTVIHKVCSLLSRISDSHANEIKSAVWSGRSLSTFQRCLLPLRLNKDQ